MLRSRIQGIIWLLLVTLAYLFSDAYFSLALFVITMAILVFLVISTRLIKNTVQFSLTVPEILDKNTDGSCYLEVTNRNILPIAKVKCRLTIANSWTREETVQEISVSINGASTEKIHFELQSKYCGKITVKLEKVIYYDYFGIFQTTSFLDVTKTLLVLPDSFYTDIEYSHHHVDIMGSAVNLTAQRGSNSNDIFGIKEYVPGDDVKQIHWKLSSKFDALMVKEISAPEDHSLLLVLETSLAKEKSGYGPEVADTMIEAFVSISKSLSRMQQFHTIGWFDPLVEVPRMEAIDANDNLDPFLKEIIEIERKEKTHSSLNAFFNRTDDVPFSHIVYIMAENGEEPKQELVPNSFITVLKCGRRLEAIKEEESTNMVIITAETIKDDLRQLMI